MNANDGARQKTLDARQVSAMAKTYDDGAWPNNFEINEDDDFEDRPGGNVESYHTLKRRASGGKAGSQEDYLNIVAQPSIESVGNRSNMMKKADLPEKF